MLVIFLKFLHFLALFFGGVSIASSIVQSAHAKAKTPPAPPVQSAMRTLGFMSLGAILVLWITGIALVQALEGALVLNWAFYGKLVGAAIVLGCSAALNFLSLNAARKKTAPDAALMKKFVSGARGGLLIALIGVAIAFTPF
ncbi:hypothetical protein OU789_10730 [Halocynthiibacter sp. C4]|uniref:hypothetical protein n=1 Tax=Halocynthiibacter sp. C4 TaxID=2992758 RepID=UPI00237AA9C2|nr:hypothetical protein [Halocynthiibacter sp. C4]MDE0590401.1 hypothetical protein [Halocynthiibacter sp. C4]